MFKQFLKPKQSLVYFKTLSYVSLNKIYVTFILFSRLPFVEGESSTIGNVTLVSWFLGTLFGQHLIAYISLNTERILVKFWILNLMTKPNKPYDTTPRLDPSI